MGVDYTAYAIIGMRIDSDKLWEERTIRHVTHRVPPGAAFCPVCGEKATQIHRRRIAEFKEDDGDFHDGDTLCGYPVLCPGETEDYYVISLVVKERDWTPSWKEHFNFKELPDDLNSIKAEMKKALGDLWDEDAFGLYAVLDVSI